MARKLGKEKMSLLKSENYAGRKDSWKETFEKHMNLGRHTSYTNYAMILTKIHH